MFMRIYTCTRDLHVKYNVMKVEVMFTVYSLEKTIHTPKYLYIYIIIRVEYFLNTILNILDNQQPRNSNRLCCF